jgi:hypothetical protein
MSGAARSPGRMGALQLAATGRRHIAEWRPQWRCRVSEDRLAWPGLASGQRRWLPVSSVASRHELCVPVCIDGVRVTAVPSDLVVVGCVSKVVNGGR